MLLGQNAKGEVLTPSYLNDPYFDNYLQAQMYAAMKYSLESWHKERIENPTLYESQVAKYNIIKYAKPYCYRTIPR